MSTDHAPGRVAVITSASSGIGEATARRRANPRGARQAGPTTSHARSVAAGRLTLRRMQRNQRHGRCDE